MSADPEPQVAISGFQADKKKVLERLNAIVNDQPEKYGQTRHQKYLQPDPKPVKKSSDQQQHRPPHRSRSQTMMGRNKEKATKEASSSWQEEQKEIKRKKFRAQVAEYKKRLQHLEDSQQSTTVKKQEEHRRYREYWDRTQNVLRENPEANYEAKPTKQELFNNGLEMTLQHLKDEGVEFISRPRKAVAKHQDFRSRRHLHQLNTDDAIRGDSHILALIRQSHEEQMESHKARTARQQQLARYHAQQQQLQAAHANPTPSLMDKGGGGENGELYLKNLMRQAHSPSALISLLRQRAEHKLHLQEQERDRKRRRDQEQSGGSYSAAVAHRHEKRDDSANNAYLDALLANNLGEIFTGEREEDGEEDEEIRKVSPIRRRSSPLHEKRRSTTVRTTSPTSPDSRNKTFFPTKKMTRSNITSTSDRCLIENVSTMELGGGVAESAFSNNNFTLQNSSRHPQHRDITRTTQTMQHKRVVPTQSFFDEYGSVDGYFDRLQDLPPLRSGYGYVSPTHCHEVRKAEMERELRHVRQRIEREESQKLSAQKKLGSSISLKKSAASGGGGGGSNATQLSLTYQGPKHEMATKSVQPPNEKRINELLSGVFVRGGDISSYLSQMKLEAKQGMHRDKSRSMKDRLGGNAPGR